jgi:hypothetical protein
MPQTESNNPGWLRSGVCIAIAILGTGYSLWLRTSGLIGSEAALFGFTCLFLFLAIVVYVLPQLQELNLRELKVVLREIKEAEQRIYARADTMKKLTIRLADILTMHLLNIGRLTGPDFALSIQKWQTSQLGEMLTDLEVTPEETERLERFRVLYNNLDAALSRDQKDPEKEKAIGEAGRKIRELLDRESSSL